MHDQRRDLHLFHPEVDRWARVRQLERLRVRSNVNRDEAHRFYPSLGFTLLKTQHNYELRLS